MPTIKAPYNFVPLSDECYFPEWADLISHDIPFSDGISGSIKLEIKAETPIFVRNGYSGNNAENIFSQDNHNRYFIPATSIKGEIRNVLEILSYGKMTQVQDSRFGIRDIRTGSQYIQFLNNVCCGWMYIENGQYKLLECGVPLRISHESIDEYFNTHIANFCETFEYSGTIPPDVDRKEYIRSADIKYKMLGRSIYDKFKFEYSRNDGNRNIYTLSDNGEINGNIIFTGQSSLRVEKDETRGIDASGKKYEFIFQVPTATAQATVVAQNVIDDFMTIHKNNFDYCHVWKKELNKGNKIPVFYTKTGREINAIGLSYMFRYPSYNHIYSAIPIRLLSRNRKDLAECIFGCLRKEQSLKSRVYFRHAFLVGEANCLKERAALLASPKPSYENTYLKNGLWGAREAMIAGRKRYPVRRTLTESICQNENMTTRFIPLDAGSVFNGEIYFHNLRPIELGALISAITFHGKNDCFHSIGMAKPLGYGKVSISIKTIETSCQKHIVEQEYLELFKNQMESVVPDWMNSAPLKELFAMARGIPDGKENDFEYMSAEIGNGTRNINQFADAKRCRISLPYFSEIIAGHIINNIAKSIVLDNNHKIVDKKAIDRFERREIYNNLINKADNLVQKELFEEAIPLLNRAEELYMEEFNDNRISSIKAVIDNNNRRTKYNEIIAEAEKFVQNKQYVEAMVLLNQAAAICPENSIHGTMISYINNIEKVNNKLSFLNEKYADGPHCGEYKVTKLNTFFSRIKSWLKSAKVQYVPADQYDIMKESLTRIISGLNQRDRNKELGQQFLNKLKEILPESIAEEIYQKLS